MGGQTKDPDYRAVCSGQTGHAEVVRIRFNPQIINFIHFWNGSGALMIPLP